MNKEGTEEIFLRAKNIAVYESNNMVTDVQSGEILYQEKSTRVKTSTEPDFIKVYYKAMMAVNAISADLKLPRWKLSLSLKMPAVSPS